MTAVSERNDVPAADVGDLAPAGGAGGVAPAGGVGRPPRLMGRKVTLRPVVASDLTRFVDIFTHPEVARWWGVYDAARVRRDILEAPGSTSFAIEAGTVVVGMIEYWEEAEPEFRHAGIDIALDPAWHGRGLGSDALRTLARHLFDDVGHHRLTIDPAVENHAAVRAYERVGFRTVGVMRRYQLLPDGEWHDGLLMDMLAEELRSPA